MQKLKLTSFSPGAGCGCKISPAILKEILGGRDIGDITSASKLSNEDQSDLTGVTKMPGLIVGNETSDDAAVFDLGNGQAVISTTDFFMPVCDDGYDFGRIASANAISDVYAMGGRPVMALSVLGWPLGKLPVELAKDVLRGSRDICREAGIPLAGGHSIDSLEPIFGLAVTGMIETENLKRNNTARPGDSIFLTKPLGVGILTTAEKKNLIKPGHENIARDSMIQLNKVGYWLGPSKEVSAMTDVTGFGLLGHLLEICEGSGVSAILEYPSVPVFNEIYKYISLDAIPGGTLRNWKSYGNKISDISEEQITILSDPQTNGGLLITGSGKEIPRILQESGIQAWRIGQITDLSSPAIVIH
jgi:selenide,water dikinase